MRLSEMAVMVAEHGARRHFEKRSGAAVPFTMGMLAPGIVHKMHERYDHVRDELDAASGQPLDASVAMKQASFNDFMSNPGGPKGPPKPPPSFGGAARDGAFDGLGALAGAPMAGATKAIGGTMEEGLKRLVFGREYGDKKDLMHMGGSATVQSFGKGLGTMGAELLKDMATKAFAAAGHAGDASARNAIIGQLKNEDPVLMNADDKVLMESYHTMTRFAPVLSTDKNAVRSFLRQAVMSGQGADFMTIKLLADAERAVVGDPSRK